VGFFGAFADLLGSFRTRGVEVGRLLRDPKTVFLIVCAPDLNRLAEAKEIDRRLSQAGCKAHGFIVNRVDEHFLPPERGTEEALARVTAMLGGTSERPRVQAFLARLEALREAHESSAAAHAQVVADLRKHAGGRPVFTAPRVPASESPRASLLALYVGLFAEDAVPAAREPEPPPPAAELHPPTVRLKGRRETDA
jgi:hypothetical protein